MSERTGDERRRERAAPRSTTTVGQAFDRRTLPPRARTALATAIARLTDAAFDDWVQVTTVVARQRRGRRRAGELADDAGDAPAGTGWAALTDELALTAYLPERYAARYSPQFIKQFALCLFTVAWKLAQPAWIRPACVAEELALRALIREAEAVLEQEGRRPFDFGDFEDEAFDDLDFEYLFTPATDGIDRSPAGAWLGMGSLAFDDWFTPFGGGAAPYSALHPYVDDDPAASYPPGNPAFARPADAGAGR